MTADGTGSGRRRRVRIPARLVIGAVMVVAVASLATYMTPGEQPTLAAGAPAALPLDPDGGAQAPPEYLTLKETSGHKLTHAMYLRAERQAAEVSTGQTAPWQFVGPTNVGGRVDDLAIDPTTIPSTVYAAVTSGGVMKSTDSGVTWTPAWPNDLPQAIGALARSSNGAMYAGTGEANPSGGGTTIMGEGLFKSTDNGATWSELGFHDSGAFGRIVVNPNNPNDVWAAATGALSWESSQRGLYHSTDGGQTWSLAIAPVNSKSGAIDVAIDPANPQVMLASMWDRYRNNGSFFYGGAGSGLYRSTDGGATWTRLDNTNITGAICAWDPTQSGLDVEASNTPDGGLGRIGIGWSSPTAADPQANRVYIVSAGANGPDKGFYVSNDTGATWTCGGAQAGVPNAGYEWVFGRMWVDPANENHIFNADVNLRVSTNGGASWSTSSGPHADQHAMIWDPNVANRVYNGDDGGVYFSSGNGNSGTWTHATTEPWNQPYHIGVSHQDETRLNIGLQDQGCVRTWRPGVPNADLTQWNSFGGCGDGHWVLINPTNQLQYFGCSQPTPPTINCTRVTDAAVSGSTTSTSQTFTRNPGWGSNARITTDTPIAIDPADPAYFYTAGIAVARSGNGVVNSGWTILSPTTPDSPGSLPGVVPANEINVDTFYANEYGAVTEIAPARATGTATTPCSTIYAGTDTGLLWKTTNATASPASDVTWTQLGEGVLPQRWVTGIQVDPTDANHVVVSFSSYKEGDRAANVWESRDGGATWTNISRNLPNAPVWMITFDQSHGLIYASSDFGVYSLYDTNPSAHWLKVGTSLPSAPVFDTKLSGDAQTVYAATFGRGVYKVAATTDTDAPATTSALAPSAAPSGWFLTDPTVTLTADDGDGSGVASTQYRIDGGAWTTYTAPFQITAEGTHTVDYYSTDYLGNVEPANTLTIRIDTTPPLITYTGNAGTYTVDQTVAIHCAATDPGGSGVDSTTCADINGPAWSFGLGSHTYNASATDVAGNVGTGSTKFTVTVNFSSLEALVRQFSTSTDVADGLVAKLAAASAAKNAKTRGVQLDAFDNQVRAQTGKALTTAQAQLLVSLADTLR